MRSPPAHYWEIAKSLSHSSEQHPSWNSLLVLHVESLVLVHALNLQEPEVISIDIVADVALPFLQIPIDLCQPFHVAPHLHVVR